MTSFIRTIWFTLSSIFRFGVPSHILSFGHSLGDNLLLTTLAKELYGRGYKNVWIKCDHSSLFANNPYVRLVLPYSALLSTTVLRLFGVKSISPVYTVYDKETDRDQIPEKHIILKMADFIGLKGEICNKPVLNLEPEELSNGKIGENHIVIVTATVGATVPITNKEWLFDRYQEVVNTLYNQVNFIQLGSVNDPKLDNVTDMRGKTTIRQSASILKNALLLVSHVGFMMHLARAVNRNAVIIYGGREMPEQSGYGCFNNIYTAVTCSPCWLHNRCDYGKKCMTAITSQQVVSTILAELQNKTPLAVDQLNNN
jgi:hypothetical protein